MSDWRTKLIVGRVVDLPEGKVVAPFPAHDEITLAYQRSLAALISAAYLFQEDDSEENLARLKLAAGGLGKGK